MRIELPNDNWVEVRENLKGKDKTRVHALLRIKIKDGDQQQGQEIGADLQELMQDELLAGIITAWSYPTPIPSESGGADAVADLDIDEYNALHAATMDLMAKVSFKVPN